MSELVYPGAEYTKAHNGWSMLGGPPRGVIHETITPPNAFYTRFPYYHLQFQQWPLPGGPVRIRQFIPLNRGSNGLRNLTPSHPDWGIVDKDVETNRQGDFNFNIALVGYQTGRTNGFPSLYPLTEAMREALVSFFLWAEEVAGIPANLDALIADPGQQEYGYNAPYRFTPKEWVRFTGWCGHERVTENTHHDPFYLFPKADLQQRIYDAKNQPPMEDDDMLSKYLTAETWGVLYDQGIVTGGSRNEVIAYWTNPARGDDEHRHASNVIVRGLASSFPKLPDEEVVRIVRGG